MRALAASRAFVVLSVLALSVVPLALASRSAVSAVLTTDPIVEIFTDSLTTYLPTATTAANDVRPQVGQRGTNIDGSLRASPAQAMAIEGNPFESAWSPYSVSGMRLDTGTFAVQDVDIALPAEGFSWVVGRSYNARQQSSGGSYQNSDGPQGKNWFQNSTPEIVLYDTTPNDKDLLYLVYGADRYAEYKRVSTSSNTFKATNGAAGIFQFTDGGAGPDKYELTDQHGVKWTFVGFDTEAYVAAGQLWKIEDPDANVAYVGDSSSLATAIDNATYAKGWTSSGYINKAYDSSDRRFSYTYTTLDSVVRLTKVEAETKTGGTWASPTGLATVAKVEYGYYSNESHGDAGSLKLVTLTTPLTDSGVELVRKKYYRYWEGAFHAVTNPGYPHGIKYIVDFEGTRQQDWADSTFDDDFLTLSDINLEAFASAHFRYDSSHRVVTAWFNGECGCSGNSNGEYAFEYESNGSFSDTTTAYDTAWKTRTVVLGPTTGYITQYWDEAHQALSRVTTDIDPDTTDPAPKVWANYVTRSSTGQVSAVATPANVTAYTHSTASFTQSTSAGLIWDYTRETSSTAPSRGYVTALKFKEGTSGTLYYEREWVYTSFSLAVGDSHAIRPALDEIGEYAVKGTTTANKIAINIAPSAYAGTIAIDANGKVKPVVPTGQNGDGSTTPTRTPYFRKDKTRSFEKGEDGNIDYRGYTKGQLTKLIEDADMDTVGDFDVSPGSLTSNEPEFHRTTTFTYDAQGRPDSTSYADGRVIKHYYSRLADRRMVHLQYNDYDASPLKFYGPVSYTVSNQSGNTEVQGTVSLTSNESTSALTAHIDETDADPITAADLGTVAQMSVSLYNETGGTVESQRAYFLVPASGAGTDGTNYDATTFGYDDTGARWRVKDATGTIHRTVYDVIGRTSARWMGTNDSSFSGGEASGTDNMVKVDELAYDSGNDKGNSLVTKRTAFIQDNATGKRETTFSHDGKGNVLLETNPLSPHAFHKLDNMGRRTSTGRFSSTASIVVGTDDPTTETANRLALDESFYDDQHQLWKTVRHKIDAADGSDDDSLEALTWRDASGRVIKQDSSSGLTKTAYDRLDRPVQEFILADHNDTAYSDADDVTGDYVLEEHQTVYDTNTHNVLMRVAVLRHHDDYGTGETLGRLDTNADADELLVTATNLEGRAQIRAYWYDAFWRLADDVQYGTNGGSNFDRDGLSVPARSDTALRTSYAYNTDGTLKEVTDPRGLVAKSEYDALGRRTKEMTLPRESGHLR